MRRHWTVLTCWVIAALLGGVVGCDKQSEETREAVRRAEKAEKRVQTLGQTVETLTDQKKDLELEIMALKEAVNKAQSGIEDSTQANSSLEMQLQQVKVQNTSLKSRLTKLQTQVQDKDRQIRELEALVKELAGSVPESDYPVVETPNTMGTEEEGVTTDNVTEE